MKPEQESGAISKKPRRLRLDQALVDRGLCESRARAQRAVLAGRVRINALRAEKPGMPVSPGDLVTVAGPERYVSRGGIKLEHALSHFGIDVAGAVAMDLGASTGGFTDCLLQHGAGRVYAVDVGRGQLAWRLREDPRVVVMERVNARHLTRAHFPEGFDLVDVITADCSFISLRHIVPPAIELLRGGGQMLVLVKPQFEAGKKEADMGRGVIRDPEVHRRILSEIEAFVGSRGGVSWRGSTSSPIAGPAGNAEFFGLIEKVRS